MSDVCNNAVNKSNRRIDWVDIAKALAMFLIVLGHVDVESSLQSIVYSFHIPAFIFLSGYCFSDREKFGTFLRKKLLRIMVPYLFFGLIAIGFYLIFGKFFSEADTLSLKECILGLLIGNVKCNKMRFNLHLWYLPFIFVMYLLFFGIKKLADMITEKIKAEKLYGYIGLFVISMIISVAVLNYKTKIYFPFGAEIAVRNLPFFALGFLLKSSGKINKDTDRKNKKEIIALVIIFIISVLSTLFFAYKNISHFPDVVFKVLYNRDYYGVPAYFYGAAFFGISAVICLSKLLPAFKGLIYFGKNTMAVLVMQIFGVMPARFVLDKLPQNSFINFFGKCFMSVAVILLCLFGDWIIQRYFPFLYGVKYKRKKNLDGE